MNRLADPRIYVCSLEQSQEPGEYTLDNVKYAYCKKTSEVLTPETETPINSLDQCFAERRQAKGHKCKCGPNCACVPKCNC